MTINLFNTISIDIIIQSIYKTQIISEKKIITDFLSNISEIANEEGFDINTNFFINYKIDNDEKQQKGYYIYFVSLCKRKISFSI